MLLTWVSREDKYMDDEPLLMKRKERNEAEWLRRSRALGYEQNGAEPGEKLLQNIGEES